MSKGLPAIYLEDNCFECGHPFSRHSLSLRASCLETCDTCITLASLALWLKHLVKERYGAAQAKAA